MRRSFDTEWTIAGEDGRLVHGRLFPFGEVTHIRETVAPGEVDEYDETFLPSCTARMRQVAAARGGAPAWISFSYDHDRSFDARLGHCLTIAEEDDGAYGTFKLIDPEPRLSRVRAMLTESHRGLSIEFADIGRPLSGPLREHRQINIADVTATPVPVYDTARILQLRAEEDPIDSAGTPNLDAVRSLLDGLREPVS